MARRLRDPIDALHVLGRTDDHARAQSDLDARLRIIGEIEMAARDIPEHLDLRLTRGSKEALHDRTLGTEEEQLFRHAIAAVPDSEYVPATRQSGTRESSVPHHFGHL